MGGLTGSSKDDKKDDGAIKVPTFAKKDELPKLKLVGVDKAGAFKLPHKPGFGKDDQGKTISIK